MTIQLTKEELAKFSNDISRWHYDCLTFILERYNPHQNYLEDVRPLEQFKTLRRKFEEQYPKPDWKTLL